MNIDAYLDRIGYRGKLIADLETLKRLHLTHLLTTPFENLDIPLGRKIQISQAFFFNKIVGENRGGFCYELNGLFSWLLEEMGFDVTLLSARVYDGDELGPEFDHLLLRVDFDIPYIVDVGFGDSFIEPFPLDAKHPVSQRQQQFRLVDAVDGKVLQRSTENSWESLYTFSLQARELSDYTDTCHFQQTSDKSPFTQRSVCSRLTQTGRVTLANDLLITTVGKDKQETKIANEAAYCKELLDHFAISLTPDTPIAKLMHPG
ncbi:MAG: arylamine N-acetyltransferase [Pseudomonadota bacterium]